jgi:hypothetical protein
MRLVIATLTLLLLIGIPLRSDAREPLDLGSPQLRAIRASVAWITYCADGKNEHRASGFLIEHPVTRKKFIVTAGHLYSGPMTLSARFEGMASPVPCDLIDVNDNCDLMVLSPRAEIKAPVLPLLTKKDPQPTQTDPVLLVGCAGGLSVAEHDGMIHAASITADALARERLGVNFKQQTSPQGDTLIIRHNAFSTEGMSGCPLVDKAGRVIGVQSGALPSAKNECFAIAIANLNRLDLNKPPKPLHVGGDKELTDAKSAPLYDKQAFKTLPIQIDKDLINAQCELRELVSTDADAVIRNYVQDKDAFQRTFTAPRLQRVLERSSVRRLTNPAFGFNVLVPESYRCMTNATVNPTGIVVSLTSTDKAVAPPYNTITLRAFLPTDSFLDAKRDFEMRIKKDGYSILKDQRDNPIAQAIVRRGYIDGVVVGQAEAKFWWQTLGIRVRMNDKTLLGPPGAEIFSSKSRTAYQPGSTAWTRINYLSESGTDGHSVHIGILENVVVLVHYQFQKQDFDDFFAGAEPSRAFLERFFIRSTVSIY